MQVSFLYVWDDLLLMIHDSWFIPRNKHDVWGDSLCCSACSAACCSVLQYVAACCSVLQYVAVCCSVLQYVAVCRSMLQCVAVCCSVLQWVAVGCSMLQYVAVCCSVLQWVAVCRSVLQCVAVCCSVLQCVEFSMCHCSCLMTHDSFVGTSTTCEVTHCSWYRSLF